MPKKSETDQWEINIRRGLLRLLVLAVIKEARETFGYAIANSIKERTSNRLIIKDGTLYPLLRRLEEQKLVRSTWNVAGERPRKYYQLTTTGNKELLRMLEFWNELVLSLDPLFRSIADGRAANGDYQEQVRFCDSCGNQVFPGALYCANCGAEISESD